MLRTLGTVTSGAHSPVPIRHRRDDQVTLVLERDEAFVEQVINRRRQQQAVLAVEALFVRAVAPGFGVARDQVLQPLHLRHATGARDALHIGAKLPLPDARQDDGFPLGVGDLRVFATVLFDSLFVSFTGSRDGLSCSARSTSFATSFT